MEKHLKSKSKITFTTTEVSDFKDWRKAFTGFGRILRKNGEVVGIREYKDANEKEKIVLENRMWYRSSVNIINNCHRFLGNQRDDQRY